MTDKTPCWIYSRHTLGMPPGHYDIVVECPICHKESIFHSDKENTECPHCGAAVQDYFEHPACAVLGEKHGHWVWKGLCFSDYPCHRLICSACKGIVHARCDDNEFLFCPYCGASMDEEEE